MEKIHISHIQLSKMLKKQQDKYNESHRGQDYLSNERLFSFAAVYYKQYSPVSCLIMGEYFDEKVDHDLVKRLANESNKRKVNPQNTPLEMDEEEWRPYLKGDYKITSDKQMDYYMQGHYVCVNKLEDDNINDDYICVDKPNELFYALARTVRLPEPDIHKAFVYGAWLDIKFYCRQFVKDVCRYYLQKRNLSPRKLAEVIKLAGFKNLGETTIRELIWNNKPINYDQFNIFAEFLSIPNPYSDWCRYKITMSENHYAFEYGYLCAIDDARKEPKHFANGILAPFIDEGVSAIEYKTMKDEIAQLRAVLESYKIIFPSRPRILFHEFYQSLGFSFEPYTGNEKLPDGYIEAMLMNFAKLWVTLPNGKKYILDTKEYERIIEKATDYTEYLLWKATTHPEIPESDDDDFDDDDDYDYYADDYDD